jgi:hypothetical protein
MPFLPILSLLWGNPWSRLIAVGALAFGFGFLKGFQSVPRVDVAAIERNAMLGRDAEWERKLLEESKIHDQRVADAYEAGKAVAALPADRPERLRICAGDAACRDRKGGR